MQMKPYAPSRASLLLCLLPVATIAAGIALWGVNIPYVDQFKVAQLLERSRAGTLTFADLFAQANEHRPLVPRLLWLGLASISRYDVRWELYLNLAIAIAAFAFFGWRTVRMWRGAGVGPPPLLLPLMSFLVFNWGQWEGWLNGFQTVFYLGSACTVIGLGLLAERPAWWRLGLAAAAGAIGTFSGVNALLYWPLGLVVIVLTAPANARRICAAAWTAIAMALLILFTVGWSSPAVATPAIVFSTLPARAYWIVNFLGAPLMTVPHLAFPLGLLSLALFAFAGLYLFRAEERRLPIAHLAIALFAAATGALISMGRLRLGIVQSVGPGYLAISAWYWAALLAVLPLLQLSRIMQRVLYSLITVCLVWQTIWGAAGARAYSLRLMRAYNAAVNGGPMTDDILQNIAQPHAYDEAREALLYLEAEGLSAYAAGER